MRAFFATIAFGALLATATTAERLEAGRCIEKPRSPAPKPATKASSCPRDPETPPPVLARGKVAFPGARGAPALDVEVARTPDEIARGLMYRESLGEGRGMLFRYTDAKIREFWMKNTCIPLDMLFISRDGTVVGMLEQVPVLDETPRSVGCASTYVLEVNAGWSRKHGVTPGMKAAIKL